MIALNTQFEVFYPHNRTVLDQSEQELQAAFAIVEALVLQFLNTKADINDLVAQNLNLLFTYRAMAIRQMQKEGISIRLDRAEVDEMASKLDYLQSNPRFEVLHQNTLFGIRVNQRVMQRLSSNTKSVPQLNRSLSIPQLAYTDFVAFMRYFEPNDFLDTLLEMMELSFRLEFGLITAILINSDHLIISDEKLAALESYLVQSGQKFGGKSYRLLPPKSPKPVIEIEETPELREWRKEQQLMADTAFEEWANIPYDEQAGY